MRGIAWRGLHGARVLRAIHYWEVFGTVEDLYADGPGER